MGWDLHPSIKLPEDGELRIADHGCGNGCDWQPHICFTLANSEFPRAWIISMAGELEDAQLQRAVLTGFDISAVHFPAPENLPGNVNLKVLDAFVDPLPEELVGKFDVVHVRVFTAVVKNGNPAQLIANAVKMLKPGGYFQWDEMDSESLKAIPPQPSVSAAETQEMLDTSLVSARSAMSLDYSWIPRLGSLFEQHGLDVLADFRMDVKKEFRKPMTDSLLMVLGHIAKIAVRDGCMVGTDKNWEELWNNSGAEIENGVSVTTDMLVCVGRKRS